MSEEKAPPPCVSNGDEGIVIVGAGQAGFWTARTLRREGYSGPLTLVGEEALPPYERPPLSKSILAGDEPTSAQLVSVEGLQELDITFMQGSRVVAIDRHARTVQTETRVIPYLKLVVCTGGRAKNLQGKCFDPAAISYLRTMADALHLRKQLATARSVLVVGGGWIGLEFAAAARKAGCDVTLIEYADTLCGRSVPPEISSYLYHLHVDKGVSVRLSTHLDSVRQGSEGTFASFNQATHQFDLVVAGIGMVPNTELAQAAGIDVDDGILVDESCRTSDPMIFAAGDVARRSFAPQVRIVRQETWQNAQTSAIVAARSLMGKPPSISEVPWFWSDQYDHNLQIAGTFPSEGGGFKRNCTDGGFCLLYETGHVLTAAIAVDAPREMRSLRRLIECRASIEMDALIDSSRPLPRG